MGYAIAVPIASRRLQAMMLEFLDENYRPFHVFAGLDPNTQGITGPLTEEGLIYDSGKLRIGFEYGAGGRDREFGWTLVRWMSRKVGKRRRFKGIPEAVPYVVYDGYLAQPVVPWTMTVDDQWKSAKVGRRCTIHDYIHNPLMHPKSKEKLRDVNEIMGLEIDRLNWKWRQWVLDYG